MWFLLGESNGARTSYFICNRTYKIGRLLANSDNDISIDGDTTVSRLHAEILIKFNENECTNLDYKCNIVLTDHSKFGTFVNGVKVKEFKLLKENDVIRFGVNNSSFRLCNDPLIVTTSCVNLPDKNIIKNLIAKLGGYLLNDWNNGCTLVIMEKLTITVKAINCLINQGYIVTKKYLQDLVECSNSLNTNYPMPENYLPEVNEPSLDSKQVSFAPCEKRKTLFKDKLFVFFDDSQMQKMQDLIELASGRCDLYKESTYSDRKYLKQSIQDLIFIIGNNKESKEQQKFSLLLESFDYRLVEETEIGMAILKSNLTEFCNPQIRNYQKDKENAEIIYKLGSQTITQTFNNCTYEPDDSFVRAEKERQLDKLTTTANSCTIFDTQESTIGFQFEKCIDDFLVVPDTPEPKRKTPSYISSFSRSVNTITATVDSCISATAAPSLKQTISPNKEINSILIPSTYETQTQPDLDNDSDYINPKQPQLLLNNIIENTPPSTKPNITEIPINNKNSNSYNNNKIQPNKNTKTKLIDLIEINEDDGDKHKLKPFENNSNKESIKMNDEINKQSLTNPFAIINDVDDDDDATIGINNNKKRTGTSIPESSIKLKETKLENKILNEPQTLSSLSSSSNLTKSSSLASSCQTVLTLNSNVVYSKSKPPKESIVNKSENNQQAIKEEKSNYVPTQVKIIFEPLVKKEIKIEYADNYNGSKTLLANENGSVRRNFKKFRKIEKSFKLTTAQQNETINSKFKRFKNDEQFDLDTQFKSFMSSTK